MQTQHPLAGPYPLMFDARLCTIAWIEELLLPPMVSQSPLVFASHWQIQEHQHPHLPYQEWWVLEGRLSSYPRHHHHHHLTPPSHLHCSNHHHHLIPHHLNPPPYHHHPPHHPFPCPVPFPCQPWEVPPMAFSISSFHHSSQSHHCSHPSPNLPYSPPHCSRVHQMDCLQIKLVQNYPRGVCPIHSRDIHNCILQVRVHSIQVISNSDTMGEDHTAAYSSTTGEGMYRSYSRHLSNSVSGFPPLNHWIFAIRIPSLRSTNHQIPSIYPECWFCFDV
mmetsp:Transcript_9140/g.13202  ORF Transcript_9140/g.13202 Transcript_9140/m.13202 type:complete len:276 (+) Transcript_9140:199-1026(+)